MTAIATQIEVDRTLKVEVKVDHCGVCNNVLTKLVRLFFYTDDKTGKKEVSRTQNETGVCTTRGCAMYIDVSKVTTWEVKEKGLPAT